MALIFFVQIPLINEHLICKYFVRLSVGNATKGLATYGCFHPCCLLKYFDNEISEIFSYPLLYNVILSGMAIRLKTWLI